MNPLRIALLALCVTGVASRATAEFQSARLEPDSPLPVYPAALVGEGITRGTVVIGVSIDETGRITDSLVLGYTNQRLVRATLESMGQWRFVPAQLDGYAVPVQTELRLDFSLTGAVITTNIMNHFFFDNFEFAGDHAWARRPARAGKLDANPTRVSGAAPAYAAEALKQGVTGRVNVRFYIDENGEVRLPAITKPVHPYLAEMAVEAVRTWKFQPLTSRGHPVVVVAQQEFAFSGER